jgi:hypothetical protein
MSNLPEYSIPKGMDGFYPVIYFYQYYVPYGTIVCEISPVRGKISVENATTKSINAPLGAKYR